MLKQICTAKIQKGLFKNGEPKNNGLENEEGERNLETIMVLGLRFPEQQTRLLEKQECLQKTDEKILCF